LDIQPVSGALGAEVLGVDLSQALSNEAASDIHDAFLAHKVLFFRDQSLTPQDQLRFVRHFGEPDVYPFIQGMADYPEVIEIVKTADDAVNFGGSWHSDTSYLPEPALGSMLYALEVPHAGGDTLFANTRLAYEALSEAMQTMLAGLVGVNSSEAGYKGGRAAGMNRINGMKDTYNEASATYESEHPIIRTHPETGAKSLYIGRGHTRRFKDMTDEESRPLIDFLATHIVRPEFTCRFRWSKGALAIWDNRTTQHYALNDYQGQRRHMQRVTIKGDRPR
jgi:taurine dioxygenase